MANSFSFKNLLNSRFKKAAITAILLIAIFSIGTYAYLASLPPQEGPKVTVTSSPLQFSMQLDKTDYSLGENISITISLKNIGSENVTIKWPSYREFYGVFWYFDFIIMDQNGTKIDQWGDVYGLLEAVLKRTLAPGDQLTTVYTWTQRISYTAVQVPKGIYSIKALSREFGLAIGNQTMASLPISLETPTITFTIT